MSLFDLAIRVKRGAALLDRKIPNWRRVLRAHRDQFDFSNGAHCVLGTLEHYSGRMQTLKRRRGIHSNRLNGYGIARDALGLSKPEIAVQHGFNWTDSDVSTAEQLEELWRAEFEVTHG